jgi:hypothetical protein
VLQTISAPTRYLIGLLVAVAGVVALADFFGPPLLGTVQPALLAFAMIGWLAMMVAGEATPTERRLFWVGAACALPLAVAGVAELFV